MSFSVRFTSALPPGQPRRWPPRIQGTGKRSIADVPARPSYPQAYGARSARQAFFCVFFNCSSSDFSFCLSLIGFHLKVLNQFYSSRGRWANLNPEDERESPRAPKPGNRSEVLSLLLYDPEGDINWIRNVVPKEEGGVPLPSTLPKDVYLTLIGGGRGRHFRLLEKSSRLSY